MEATEVSLINYNDVITNIKDQENHLLIGNGFNYGLGIDTKYSSIFKKMIENNKGVYHEARPIINECGFDLEVFIGKLEADINENNVFLKKYIRNKVKFDFMQATNEIVKSEIKNIYAEKNEGVYLLFQNFTNYFSLNFDFSLYLLLLKYKASDDQKNNSVAFQSSINFIEEDLNAKQNNIYTEIKKARKEGILIVNIGAESATISESFNKLTKTHFALEVKAYAKTNKKGWSAKDIDRVVKKIFEEEQRIKILKKVDDGSRPLGLFEGKPEFVFDLKSRTQNLFFLHGAFHIYKDGKFVKKITQNTEKALYDKLEQVINDEEKDIVCVFQQNNKTDVIESNGYLLKCLNKLGELKGNMVIIGSSLADNDDHIFEKINNSDINTVYISTLKSEKENNFHLAQKKFPLKNIVLFDAETISYEIVDYKEHKEP